MVTAPLQLSTAVQQGSHSAQYEHPYYLLMVTEKATAKEVDNPNYISALQGRLLQDWIDTEMGSKKTK